MRLLRTRCALAGFALSLLATSKVVRADEAQPSAERIKAAADEFIAVDVPT